MWENRHESIAAEYTKRASKCAWLKLLKKLKVFDANKLVQQLREARGSEREKLAVASLSTLVIHICHLSKCLIFCAGRLKECRVFAFQLEVLTKFFSIFLLYSAADFRWQIK